MNRDGGAWSYGVVADENRRVIASRIPDIVLL